MDVAFLHYSSPLSLCVDKIDIRTLPGLEEAVALVTVEADWVYAPPQAVSHFGSGGRYIRTMPYASRVFGLPRTHALRHTTR